MVPTGLVEAADPVLLDKDVDLGSVSVIMIVMREIAGMPFNQTGPISAYVPNVLAEPVPTDLPVVQLEDAQHSLPVPFPLPLSIAVPDAP